MSIRARRAKFQGGRVRSLGCSPSLHSRVELTPASLPRLTAHLGAAYITFASRRSGSRVAAAAATTRRQDLSVLRHSAPLPFAWSLPKVPHGCLAPQVLVRPAGLVAVLQQKVHVGTALRIEAQRVAEAAGRLRTARGVEVWSTELGRPRRGYYYCKDQWLLPTTYIPPRAFFRSTTYIPLRAFFRSTPSLTACCSTKSMQSWSPNSLKTCATAR